ncbi:hypothetical protein LEQ41_07940 [Streptococcus agalactiae]|nr:hypothetical protein [Streptococcus agalactiae]
MKTSCIIFSILAKQSIQLYHKLEKLAKKSSKLKGFSSLTTLCFDLIF